MALTKALQKRIDLANKYIKFAQKHDILGRGYFGSTMESVLTYPHLITVSPTGRSVTVRYKDAYWKKETHSESFNTNDEYRVSDLRSEISNYIIKAIKNGAKEEGISIPKALSNPTKRKNSPNDNRIPREHALAAGGLIAQVHAGEREPFPFPIKLYLLAIGARDWDGKEYQIEQDREAAIEARQILMQEVGRLRALGISPYKKSNPRKRKNKGHTKWIQYLVLQGNYGYGWDDVAYENITDDGFLKARRAMSQTLKEYRANERGVAFRTIKRKELRSKSNPRKRKNAGLNIVTVKFKNSKYNYETEVSPNTTAKSAYEYFVGQSFDMGSYPRENIQRVIGIDFNGKPVAANPRKRKNGSKSSHGFRYPKGKHKAKSWDRIVRDYDKNRDYDKKHSANFLMLAEALGRPESVLKELRSLKRRTDRSGFDKDTMQRQYKLTKGDYARAMKYMKADKSRKRKNPDHKGEVNPYSKRYTYMDFTKKFWGKDWRTVPRDIRLSFWDDFKYAHVGGLQNYKEATRG